MSTSPSHLVRIYGEPWTALPAELRSALPEGKHDVACLGRWEHLSERERYCLVPFMLVWLQDYNWPVAPHVHARLMPMGSDLVPFLKSVLEGSDEVWKYWIVDQVVPALPLAAFALMRPELERLAATPSAEEVHLVAAAALALLG